MHDSALVQGNFARPQYTINGLRFILRGDRDGLIDTQQVPGLVRTPVL